MNQEPVRSHVPGWPAIAVALCLSVTGVLMFKVLPLVVGAAADSFQLGPADLGRLASSDLAGITLAALSAPLWTRRLDWRRCALLALLIVVTGNVASAFVHHLPRLLVIRVVTGVGEGMASSLALVILGTTRNPDRAFGLAVAAPIAVGLAAFQFLPPLVAEHGYAGVVLCLAGLAALALPLTPLLPRGGRPAPGSAPADGLARGTWSGSVAAGLTAAAIYHVGLGAVWAFIERMGVVAGLPRGAIGTQLGLAVLFGLAGALLAAAIGARYGRLWPLVLAVAGQCLALLLLGERMTLTAFGVAACAYQFLWLLSVPYQIGIIASLDATGRFFVLALAAQATGVTLGPLVAGALIVGQDFTPVHALAAGCLLTSLAVFIPLTRFPRTSNRG